MALKIYNVANSEKLHFIKYYNMSCGSRHVSLLSVTKAQFSLPVVQSRPSLSLLSLCTAVVYINLTCMTNDAADCDELMSEHATDIYSIEKIVRHRTLHIPTGSAAHPPPHPFLHLLSALLLSWPGPHPTGDQRSTSPLLLLLFPTSLPCD